MTTYHDAGVRNWADIVTVVFVLIASFASQSVVAEPRDLPSWTGEPVGSYAHPLGIGSLYARCSWAGVFPDSAGWETFVQGPSLRNAETLEKLDAAVHFFTLLQDRNHFYMRSMSRTISESVLLPTRKFVSGLIPAPAKGEYETTQGFSTRRRQWELQEPSYSFVIRDETVYGLSGLPNVEAYGSGITYDADKSEFSANESMFVADILNRIEQRIRYKWGTDEEVREKDVVTLKIGPNISRPFLQSSPELAKRLQPYLVLVATGKTVPSEFGSYASLHAVLTISVDKLEIRNVCTNQSGAVGPRRPAIRPTAPQ